MNGGIRRGGMVLLFLAGGLFSAAGQELSVGMLRSVPEVDGRAGEEEYDARRELQGMVVSAGYWDETLYIALEGETQGWVAAGFGSRRMDGAYMAIGFAGPGGTPTFREMEGHLHSLRRAGDSKVEAYAVREEGSVTTLELAVPLAEWQEEDRRIPMILALGDRDSLAAMHSWHSSFTLRIRVPAREY